MECQHLHKKFADRFSRFSCTCLAFIHSKKNARQTTSRQHKLINIKIFIYLNILLKLHLLIPKASYFRSMPAASVSSEGRSRLERSSGMIA